MPVEDYVVGTGLTKRDRRRIIFSKPPTAEEREAAKEMLIPRTFDRAVEETEAWAIGVLKAAGQRTDGKAHGTEMQSQEWYANEIVSMLSRNRSAIIRVAAGKVDWADDLARACLNLGYLICEAKLKFEWEEDTVLGTKVRAGGAKGAKERHDTTDSKRDVRVAAWKAARARGLGKTEADKAAGVQCGVSDRVIREARKNLK